MLGIVLASSSLAGASGPPLPLLMEGFMARFPSPRRAALVILLAVAAFAVAVAGCSKDRGTPLSPTSQNLGELTMANPIVRNVAAVQDRHTSDLMSIPGVVGTATGLNDAGELTVMVLTEHALGAGRLPATLEGVPVFEEVTGRIRAMSIADHQVKQTPPIALGTSGGWRYDLANGFCCGGTLGSLVHKGTTQYVLSNYHVLESDIVSGGNGRVAQAGDPVGQPGPVAVNCTPGHAQNVGR